MPKLEFDISVKEGGIKELNRQIREMTNATSRLVAEFGKESDVARKAGNQLQNLKDQKRELVKATNDLSGGLKKSSAQLLEMGENITVVMAGIKSIAGGLFNFGKSAITSAADFEELRSHFIGAESDIYNFQKATAFTTGKGDLIKLSNQASDLGIELSKQPMFFLLAKTAVEKYGTDLSTAFQSVIMATEGNIRGLKQIGVQKEVYKQIVSELTQTMGGEVEVTQSLNGEQEINIKNLDPLVQKNIRLEAILKATGVTMEDVNKKTQSNADKLAQLDLLVPQVKKQFGELLADGVIPLTDALRNSEGKFNTAALSLAGIGMAGAEILPTLAMIKIAFPSLAATVAGSTAAMASAWAAMVGVILLGANQLKSELGVDIFSGNIMTNLQGLVTSKYATNRAIEKGMESIKSMGMDKPITDKIVQDALKTNEAKYNKYKTFKIPQINTGRGGTTSRGSETINEEKQILNIYQEQEKIISDLQSKLLLNLGYTGAELEINKQILEAKQRLYFLETGRDINKAGIIGSDLTMPERNMQTYTGGTSFIQSKDISVIIQGISEPLLQAGDEIQNIFSDLISTLGIQADSFVGRLVSGFDTVLSIVNMIVNTLNAVNAVKGLIGAITSIIPGGGLIANAATAMGGTPGGMVMPMTQSGGMRPTINVVVQSEVEKTKAIKFFDNNFNAYQNYLRANSY